MREIYRNSESELARFENNAIEYINRIHTRKSIEGLCEHLGITRKTLSKYKQRNYLWRESIEEIKRDIADYNWWLKHGNIYCIIEIYLDQSPRLLQEMIYKQYKGKPDVLYEFLRNRELMETLNKAVELQNETELFEEIESENE